MMFHGEPWAREEGDDSSAECLVVFFRRLNGIFLSIPLYCGRNKENGNFKVFSRVDTRRAVINNITEILYH